MSQIDTENFFHTLFCSCCAALICLLQQMYYSAKRVQEPQKDEVLCDNCEELKAVNYYHKVLSILSMTGLTDQFLTINNSDH